MKAELTQEMKENIANAIGIKELKLKYSPAFDINSLSREPKEHRILCKGDKTENKWVWLGDKNGPYSFESPAQARLFIKELSNDELA
ncbi:hypothetical protein [Vibrio europaeus]|uniref:hypothetical protein n=1 Tax=Vibrio europaeus TaxID=300876 RepID=UPI00148D5FE5|nr:hypothetical protein [Vibrio europaeus]NOH26494.1 hypothetical protein [Vibrio europaeus]